VRNYDNEDSAFSLIYQSKNKKNDVCDYTCEFDLPMEIKKNDVV
jgi:hypothetical protein